MKSSMKTVFVLLAIVMSFVTVQAVWAGSPTNKTEVTVEGKVNEVNRDAGSITVLDELQGEDTTKLVSTTVYGLGSQSYWKDNCIEFPSQNEYVRILAYRCDDATDTDRLIAIDVTVCLCDVNEESVADPNCTNGYFECDRDTEGVEFIQLRDDSTYIPLWRGKPAGGTGQ